MPQTSTTSAGLLKEMYDEGARDIINLEAPTYSGIKKKTDDIGGKRFVLSVKMKSSHGTGVRNESEALPGALNFNYQQPVVVPKYAYQAAELTGQADARSGSSEMAFESVLSKVLTEGVEVFARDRNRAIFADGTSLLATTSAVTTTSTTVTCDNLQGVENIEEGMLVDILDTTMPDSGAKEVDGIEVSTVDKDGKTFTLASNQTIDTAIMAVVGKGNRDTTKAKDILGFDSAFDDGTNTATYFGVSRDTYRQWKGNNVNASNVDITNTILQKLYNKIVKIQGKKKVGTLEILTNLGQEEKMADIVLPSQRTVGSQEYKVGYTGIWFKDMMVMTDTQCPLGKIYFINHDTIARHVLLDGTWGNLMSVWFSHHGLDTAYDKFTAMYKCYEEVVCNNPHANGIIYGLPEPA